MKTLAMHHVKIYWSLLLLLFFTFANAQTLPFKPVRTAVEYKRTVAANKANRMVELKTMIPGIVYDLRYASSHNFMHRLMYPRNTNTTFLRTNAASALQQVQKELIKSGLGLKVFDAYRPLSVTQLFWDLIKDERYVANPANGSNHNRGTAIDLTIINLSTGDELPMGTGFDNFTDTAHHSFTKLPQNIIDNRNKLKFLMGKYNFKPLSTEWWHYTFSDGHKYDVLDLSFKQLVRLNR